MHFLVEINTAHFGEDRNFRVADALRELADTLSEGTAALMNPDDDADFEYEHFKLHGPITWGGRVIGKWSHTSQVKLSVSVDPRHPQPRLIGAIKTMRTHCHMTLSEAKYFLEGPLRRGERAAEIPDLLWDLSEPTTIEFVADMKLYGFSVVRRLG
jgi:hypothetical protein